MTDVRYWLWLQLALGAGARFKEIIDDFGSIEALYASNLLEWKMSPALSPQQIEKMQRYTLDDTEEILSACKKYSCKIITYDDKAYPTRLKRIVNPPAVIYVDGNLPDIDSYAVIGIVGTRKASSYALKASYVMAKGISLCNAIVVSGGALGVDTAAHKGALELNKPTVAVLGSGFGTSYLKTNEELRESIKSGGGALISEYPPYTEASKFNFPMRNRIISGLSLGVLVVEAGEKSGSLITAKHAREQRRDVFVIPASIFDYNFLGTNRLIDDGAYIATTPERLIEQYASSYETLDLSKIKTVRELFENESKNANTKKRKQVAFDNIVKDRAQRVSITQKALELNGNEKIVYSALSEEYMLIDEIISKTSLNAKEVLTALTLLEMKGVAQSASGKRFRLK